jgi:cyclophilin family peptidyl-prolyl cis-trans isomerase
MDSYVGGIGSVMMAAGILMTLVGMAAAGDATALDPALKQVDDFIVAKGISTNASGWRTSLPKFPELTFTKGKSYFLDFKTNKGDIRLKLLPDAAPKHAANFVYLARLGFFDGLKFHRVITGFMAQGGCPVGTGTGSPGYRFEGEFASGLKHDRPGLLSMANAGPGTDGSQFFITFVPTAWLDGKHTLFGEVVSGMDTVKALEQCGSRGGQTSEPLSIQKAAISVE